ncbi:MAG: hypothetical protein A2X61_17105 [Ignavibacteria bacterium GWB2_35_12]|nr:MAG: hypothetical protein A2X61_17105 [Ignavibacteria bacterium GWB2_35_12]OGU94519.1 MAG: hypothetical protein A2220_01460 [Ignavibacteria bacterium RIFOXYA2_FULL_35_10]OGV19071.1 MAG: hypothetical protein A2475_07645 [Ignavibacteria bacterium RIFOXYC2_FULL_35_21]
MGNSGYKGFTPEVRKFYQELEKNNNKEWFQANKARYEEIVREPAKELVYEMGLRFAKSGLPYYADPKKSLFRVNRDIRFSANKDPYKTNFGVLFPFNFPYEASKAVEVPGLYFHIEAKESFIAGGLHMPSSDKLKELRELIAGDWKELFKIVNQKKFKAEFPIIFAEDTLKNMPRGYEPDHPAAEWLKMKGYTVGINLEFKEVYGPKLADILERKGKVIAPFLEFLGNAGK